MTATPAVAGRLWYVCACVCVCVCARARWLLSPCACLEGMPSSPPSLSWHLRAARTAREGRGGKLVEACARERARV